MHCRQETERSTCRRNLTYWACTLVPSSASHMARTRYLTSAFSAYTRPRTPAETTFEDEKVGGSSSPLCPPLGSSNSKLKIFGLEHGEDEGSEASDQVAVGEDDRGFDPDVPASIPASIDRAFFKTCSPDLARRPNVAMAERKVGRDGGSEAVCNGMIAESW